MDAYLMRTVHKIIKRLAAAQIGDYYEESNKKAPSRTPEEETSVSLGHGFNKQAQDCRSSN